MKNDNKRTLKKRIYRLLTMFNFGTLLVMMLALIISIGLVFNMLSYFLSSNMAKQMSYQLKSDWNYAIKERKIPKIYKGLTPVYESIFRKLGDNYQFNHMDREDIMNISHKPPIKDLDKNIIPFLPKLLAADYTITINSKKVYPLVNKKISNSGFLDAIRNMSFIKFLNSTSVIKVKDDSNNEIATIKVRLNPDLIIGAYSILLILSLFVFFVFFMFSKFVSMMISSAIIRPINELDIKMKQLAAGELDTAKSYEIKLKKPVKEIESLARSANIIMSKMYDYVNTLGNQKLELEAQNSSLQENSNSLEIMNLDLAYKNIKLKNILDNVDQGFFSFKNDLLISGEYSLICEKFFCGKIANKTLGELLYPNNANMNKFTKDLLEKLFSTDESSRKIYLPLMPEEITLNERVINLAYKFVNDNNNENAIMVILTDITDKRYLEKLMDEERNVLKMVVKSIINRDEFLELEREFVDFINQLKKDPTSFNNEQILRQIHTYKGNFSQYDMVNIVPELNMLEDNLYEIKDMVSCFNINEDKLLEKLNNDMDTIISYAGKDFIREGEYCYIKKDKLLEIEKKIKKTLTKQECKVILPLIKNLRYKSVAELLKIYPDYVMKLSERLGKSLHQIEITGDEIFVDTNYYNKVIKSLSHVFRNCVDHGIETEDERLEAGKSEAGNISCMINNKDDKFEIIISDDGRGIDIESLKQKVLKQGLYSEEEWDKLTKKQQYDMIFEHGISTKDEVTYVSGRGVGMAAVKEVVNEVGGSITVSSTYGEGTTFIITLPKFDEYSENNITSDEFIIELANTTQKILIDHTGDLYQIGEIRYQNAINLNNITALISLSGSLNSIIMISVNKKMAENLVKHFILSELSEKEISNYIEDIVGEVTNTILGNAFGYFENKKCIFNIGLPAVLSNNEAYVKFTQSQILAVNLQYNDLQIDINMLMVNEDNELNYI